MERGPLSLPLPCFLVERRLVCLSLLTQLYHFSTAEEGISLVSINHSNLYGLNNYYLTLLCCLEYLGLSGTLRMDDVSSSSSGS